MKDGGNQEKRNTMFILKMFYFQLCDETEQNIEKDEIYRFILKYLGN